MTDGRFLGPSDQAGTLREDRRHVDVDVREGAGSDDVPEQGDNGLGPGEVVEADGVLHGDRGPAGEALVEHPAEACDGLAREGSTQGTT